MCSPLTIDPKGQLPKKFDRHILNNHLEDPLLARTRWAVSWLSPRCIAFKTHIMTYDGMNEWIFKINRSELNGIATDAHIYRVRKAAKIQALIEKNGWHDAVVVPEKHLFYHEEQKRWYVVAKKMDVKEKSFCQITPMQAKALATILFEAKLTDIHSANIQFDQKGRLAIIDTEPYERAKTQQIKKSVFCRSYLLNASTMKHLFLASAMKRLKCKIDDPVIKKEFNAVVEENAKKVMGVCLTQLACLALAFQLLKYTSVPYVTTGLHTVLFIYMTLRVMEVSLTLWHL